MGQIYNKITKFVNDNETSIVMYSFGVFLAIYVIIEIKHPGTFKF